MKNLLLLSILITSFFYACTYDYNLEYRINNTASEEIMVVGQFSSILNQDTVFISANSCVAFFMQEVGSNQSPRKTSYEDRDLESVPIHTIDIYKMGADFIGNEKAIENWVIKDEKSWSTFTMTVDDEDF